MKITVNSSPIPSNFRGTPQQLLEAFLDRIEIVASELFPPEDTMPAGNEGPWFKNGTQIWVWDESTSTYIPLDISASYTPQIFVGSTDPNADVGLDTYLKYNLWLKTSGGTVVGLFNWMGTTLGWVQKPAELGADVITETMLKTDSVTRDKIKNGEVIASKLANDLPLAKWERGTTRQFIRMKDDASEAHWTTFITATTELAIVLSSKVSIEHTLPVTPNYVSAVLVCKEIDAGWAVGDELDVAALHQDNSSGDQFPIPIGRNATKVWVSLRGNQIAATNPDTHVQSPLTTAKWKLKFYVGVG